MTRPSGHLSGSPYPIGINLVDLVIVGAVLIGIANGYARGLWLSAAQYTGLVIGVIAGAAAAPIVTTQLGLSDVAVRRLVAVLVLVIGGSLGSSIGYALGSLARRRVAAPPTEAEHAGGAVFSALAVLAVAWFLGLTFDRGPSPQVAGLVEGSSVLRALDRVAPRPPGALARVEAIIAQAPFPQTFAELAPNLPGTLEPPASIDTQGVRDAAAQTYEVEGRGCSGVVSGSAFPISADHLVTNAHVVSGTSGTRVVSDTIRGSLPASVVLFDPERDVAVLFVPGAHFRPLAPATGARGTQGAVIGYPEGGPLTASPSVVEGTIQARGRDIYNQDVVDRQIYVLGAAVRPGNSGGPLVDLEGHELGVVFAASSTSGDQAYALTNDEIAGDVQTGLGRTARLDTSQYPCAV